MKQKKNNKNAHETLKIIEEILDYNKNAQKKFPLASKVNKEKSEPTSEENIAKRIHLRRENIAEIEEEEKNINNELFKKYFTNNRSPSDMYKKLHKTEGKKNEDQVYVIKEVLNKRKDTIKNASENKQFKTEKNEKIINIVESILYFNQSGEGLKIITPNQMLSRLPIF